MITEWAIFKVQSTLSNSNQQFGESGKPNFQHNNQKVFEDFEAIPGPIVALQQSMNKGQAEKLEEIKLEFKESYDSLFWRNVFLCNETTHTNLSPLSCVYDYSFVWGKNLQFALNFTNFKLQHCNLCYELLQFLM